VLLKVDLEASLEMFITTVELIPEKNETFLISDEDLTVLRLILLS